MSWACCEVSGTECHPLPLCYELMEAWGWLSCFQDFQLASSRIARVSEASLFSVGAWVHSRGWIQHLKPPISGLHSPYSRACECGQSWILLPPKLQSKQNQRSGAEVHLPAPPAFGFLAIILASASSADPGSHFSVV